MQQKNKSDFIFYLSERSLENYLFVFGFMFGVGAYSFWHPLEQVLNVPPEREGQFFYIGISVAFFFYTLAYAVSKYKTWRWFPLFVASVCGARVFTELNPELAQKYDWLEYLMFLVTAGVFVFYWGRYKWNKFYGLSKIKKL